MNGPSEDPRKLEITLRHYQEGYTSQALTTAKLQAEIVHLKANVDYLEQCLAEERGRKSESVSTELPTANGSGASALNTPPMSDRGSIAQSVAFENKAQSSDTVDSPLPEQPRKAIVTYSRKRTIAPDRDQSRHPSLPPEDKAGPSRGRKRTKSVVHVLVPPLSQDKRHAFSRAPLSIHEDEGNLAPRAVREKPKSFDSIQPVQAAGREVRHLRSRSRELSYVDPPALRRSSNSVRRRSAAPAESSSAISHSSQPLHGTNLGQTGNISKHAESSLASHQQDSQRVLRTLPLRSTRLRSPAPVPANPGTPTSADVVDRLCDIPSLDVHQRKCFSIVNDCDRMYDSQSMQSWSVL